MTCSARAASSPDRPATRTARPNELAALVPADQPLYLFRVKDEGIMFCYGRCHAEGQPERVVRRLNGPNDLPLDC